MVHAFTFGNAHTFPSKWQCHAHARQVHHISASPPTELPPWINIPITFGPEDVVGISLPHHNALLISAVIVGCVVRCVFVDGGSFADILFASTFDKLGISRALLSDTGIPLLGFGSSPVPALGKIKLMVDFEAMSCVRSESMVFDVVDIPYQYNVILGWVAPNHFGAIPHHAYLCTKLPGPSGVITVHGNQDLSRKIDEDIQVAICYVHAVAPEAPKVRPGAPAPPTSGKWVSKPMPDGETKVVPLLDKDPSKVVLLGVDLSPLVAEALLATLQANYNIFVWGHEDLPGVLREIIEH